MWPGHTGSIKVTRLLTKSASSLLGAKQGHPSLTLKRQPGVFNIPGFLSACLPVSTRTYILSTTIKKMPAGQYGGHSSSFENCVSRFSGILGLCQVDKTNQRYPCSGRK